MYKLLVYTSSPPFVETKRWTPRRDFYYTSTLQSKRRACIILRKFNKKGDNSHLNLRRQARDDALRDWKAQIDQLRRQEHEVIDIKINAIADLGANVNIMSESMLEELSLADPKKANIIVEMADKTRAKVIENQIHQRIVTPVRRVILFDTIPTIIPDTTLSVTSPTTHIDTTPIPTTSPTILPSPDYTPGSPDYSTAFDTEFDPSEDPSSDHIPPLPATSPFLSSTNDSSDSDTPDTPPLPTHGTPFTETTLSTQRSPTASGALRRRVMILAPG
ncbi:hypothetical protein Tco_1437325 [Tanacetum coccineum]